MTARAIHWHEGMFLRPHHFQAAQRYWSDLSNTGEKWDLHYNWGLRAIVLDQEALANHRLVIRSLRARLPDGTLVAIPEDGNLPALDLKEVFDKHQTATVFLGVPQLQVGRPNVPSANGDRQARFLLDTLELEDENTGVNPQAIQVRLLNLTLLLSPHDQAGYEVLPIARIEKSPRADGTPQLDLTYIPPVLACDAWQPLEAGIVQAIYDAIGKRIELLAGLTVTRGITFDSQAQGDPAIFAQLRALNEGYALLGTLAFAQGIHPLHAYLELCRLVGQLAIFSDRHRPPDLPKYDHDDLGGCFYAVKQHIFAILDKFHEPDYRERPFVGAGLRMQVTLEPAWLESVWEMYIGVQSRLSAEECNRLLTKPGQLDMKIGSSDRVDEIFQLGQAGLKFTYSSRPPRALPTRQGLYYFQINRESSQEEWQNVQRSLTLAIRLNQNRIAGDIQGQQVLTVRTAGQTTTLQFTLYVVPRSK